MRRAFVLLAFLAAILPSAPACTAGGGEALKVPTGTWSKRQAMPTPRQAAATAELDGKVYVIGGLGPNDAEQSTVEAYDPKTNKWEAKASLPVPLHDANAVGYGGRLYVFGSLRTGAHVANGETLVFDPVQNAWSKRASMPAGSERGGAYVAVLGNLVFVAGGVRGGIDASVDDVWSYDTLYDTWTKAPSLPSARDRGVAAVIDKKVLVLGGRSAGQKIARVDELDTVTGAWKARAPLPTPRGRAAGGLSETYVIVAGGENGSGGALATVEAYEPAADRWWLMPDMPTPRFGTNAAIAAGVMVFPGGATQPTSPSDAVEALQVQLAGSPLVNPTL
jgi:N-acetylneuraminic acid mutarotase